MAGVSLRERVRSSVFRERLGLEPLTPLLREESAEEVHLVRMPTGRLLWEVLQAPPAGRRPRGRPKTWWRVYISTLAWERLRAGQSGSMWPPGKGSVGPPAGAAAPPTERGEEEEEMRMRTLGNVTYIERYTDDVMVGGLLIGAFELSYAGVSEVPAGWRTAGVSIAINRIAINRISINSIN